MKMRCLLLCLGLLQSTANAVELIVEAQTLEPKFVVENHLTTGIVPLLVVALNQQLAAQDIYFRLSDDNLLPWPRIINNLEFGRAQVCIGLAKTPERAALFKYSRVPVYSVTMLFMKQAGNPFQYTGPDSLRGLRVGVLRGTNGYQMLAAIPGVTVEPVDRISHLFKKLDTGRNDLIFHHHLALLYNQTQLGYTQSIVAVDTPFQSHPHWLAYHRDVADSVIAQIDLALEQLRAAGTIDTILQHYARTWKPSVTP